MSTFEWHNIWPIYLKTKNCVLWYDLANGELRENADSPTAICLLQFAYYDDSPSVNSNLVA